jgi:hypothetical protein
LANRQADQVSAFCVHDWDQPSDESTNPELSKPILDVERVAARCAQHGHDTDTSIRVRNYGFDNTSVAYLD